MARKSSRKRAGFLTRNGLSLVLLGLVVFSMIGQVLSGHAAYLEDLAADGLPPVGLGEYLSSGHFLSATFENWESEFFQMGLYVFLTAKLYQAGSAESRPLPGEPESPPLIAPGDKPGPVRRGVLWLKLYENSLSIAFLLLFAVSFVLHWHGSWRHHLVEEAAAGQPPDTLMEHLASAQFWFESFQNWQSEFLSVLVLVVLSIWLRQKDSPESKEVEAPHSQTGS